jgi:hypothetical protein
MLFAEAALQDDMMLAMLSAPPVDMSDNNV